jgi:hypothetical protein
MENSLFGLFAFRLVLQLEMKNKKMRRNPGTPPNGHMDTQMDERFPWEYGSTVVQSSLLVSHRYHIISLDFLRFEQERIFVTRDWDT